MDLVDRVRTCPGVAEFANGLWSVWTQKPDLVARRELEVDAVLVEALLGLGLLLAIELIRVLKTLLDSVGDVSSQLRDADRWFGLHVAKENWWSPVAHDELLRSVAGCDVDARVDRVLDGRDGEIPAPLWIDREVCVGVCQLGESLHDGAVLALDSALRLRPVGRGEVLLEVEHLGQMLENVVDKVRTAVGAKHEERTEDTDDSTIDEHGGDLSSVLLGWFDECKIGDFLVDD